MKRRATGYAVALLVIFGACERRVKPEIWHAADGHRWRALDVHRRGQPGFALLSPSTTGINFTNSVSDEKALENRHLVQGSGVALGDVDGDGRTDIFFSHIQGQNRLYRNLGDWKFEDITQSSGVTTPGTHSTGAVLADTDGDGDLDLVVSAMGGPNLLFVNDGGGNFALRQPKANLGTGRGSTTMALADVDGDGDLDLYIANYKTRNVQDLFSPQERAFERVVRRVGDSYEIAPGFREHYRAEVRSDLGAVVRTQRADPDWFYLNDGAGNFSGVSLTEGRFLDEAGKPIARPAESFSLTARFFDANGDGAPDLYVCNDFEDPDEFWLNRGDGNFQMAPALSLRSSSNSSMAMDFSDIDRDGDIDFLVVDMLSRPGRRRKTQSPTHTPLPNRPGEYANRPQMQRNTMFLNRGNGTFAEVAAFARVEASDWSWSTVFMDADLDGYEDILVGTGHRWDVMDSDTWDRIKSRFPSAQWNRELLLFPDLHLKNVAFRNNGDLTFADVSTAWGFTTEGITHGMALGDLDGDGDLDLVTNRFGNAAGVYRNEAASPRIAVRLIGQAPNTQAVGARIRVLGGPVAAQEKEVTLGGLYLSSSDPLYSFAAVASDTLSVEVRWRNGAQTVVAGVLPNRLYEIRQQPAALQPDTRPAPESALPIFTDVSDQLRHRHTETSFDDFARQPLLPNRLSQLGPGVSWYDVDSDGDEDLLVASGRGGALELRRNDASGFTPVTLGPTAEHDQTTVLALPGGTGATTALLVGQSSYETESPAQALAIPSVVQFQPSKNSGRSSFPSTAVAGDTSSVGSLALSDIDTDGDLDLFVAGRTIPGAYPLAASSRLLRNEGGRFIPDTANQEVFSALGLVSAAVFSDIDSDGDPDLIVAAEWGPLTIFKNTGGRFSRDHRSANLATYQNRWNGVTTGDLDGDGRPDIIATGWGRNTLLRASRKLPLFLYYGNFDDNGSLDLVRAQRDEHVKDIAPVETFSRLTLAIPQIRRRTPTFGAYADASLSDVLGSSFARAGRLEVVTHDHMSFLNRGDSFLPAALPAAAQLAPAFYAGIADFDGDGREDIFLSQNFFPMEIATPRHDAGLGIWLRGDGAGKLAPVSAAESGISVFGDQRGAALADYNRDGRVDLVVTQNGAETKLYRNDRGMPGIRVRLLGPPGNPHGVGAVVRLRYAEGLGPAREIHAGSGYWSQDGAVQVMGLREPPAGVWVRWPGGKVSETTVIAGAREVTIRAHQ
ncbi:MAG: VCBS repeat-containing protein [Gemmatimonadaceae bacterium]